jgi:hypothetical protein
MTLEELQEFKVGDVVKMRMVNINDPSGYDVFISLVKEVYDNTVTFDDLWHNRPGNLDFDWMLSKDYLDAVEIVEKLFNHPPAKEIFLQRYPEYTL